MVDLYEHNNYRGEHLASYQTMNHYGQYFGKLVSSIEDRVSSIRLGPGCLKVKLFDEDNCREDGDYDIQNKNIYTSCPDVGRIGRRQDGSTYGTDLDNDVCALRLLSKRKKGPSKAEIERQKKLEAERARDAEKKRKTEELKRRGDELLKRMKKCEDEGSKFIKKAAEAEEAITTQTKQDQAEAIKSADRVKALGAKADAAADAALAADTAATAASFIPFVGAGLEATGRTAAKMSDRYAQKQAGKAVMEQFAQQSRNHDAEMRAHAQTRLQLQEGVEAILTSISRTPLDNAAIELDVTLLDAQFTIKDLEKIKLSKRRAFRIFTKHPNIPQDIGFAILSLTKRITQVEHFFSEYKETSCLTAELLPATSAFLRLILDQRKKLDKTIELVKEATGQLRLLKIADQAYQHDIKNAADCVGLEFVDECKLKNDDKAACLKSCTDRNWLMTGDFFRNDHFKCQWVLGECTSYSAAGSHMCTGKHGKGSTCQK